MCVWKKAFLSTLSLGFACLIFECSLFFVDIHVDNACSWHSQIDKQHEIVENNSRVEIIPYLDCNFGLFVVAGSCWNPYLNVAIPSLNEELEVEPEVHNGLEKARHKGVIDDQVE